jgi:hypothetical protein
MQQNDIATLDIAEIGEALFERLRKDSADLGRRWVHVAYAPDPARLLSRGAKGQCRRSAANYANKIASPHSISSLAWASSKWRDGEVECFDMLPENWTAASWKILV